MVRFPKPHIAQNAIVFRDMYLQCPARNNNGYAGGYVLDEYQIHKTNTATITELAGEA